MRWRRRVGVREGLGFGRGRRADVLGQHLHHLLHLLLNLLYQDFKEGGCISLCIIGLTVWKFSSFVLDKPHEHPPPIFFTVALLSSLSPCTHLFPHVPCCPLLLCQHCKPQHLPSIKHQHDVENSFNL